jgi:hypothetical protein
MGQRNGWRFHWEASHLRARSDQLLAELAREFISMGAGHGARADAGVARRRSAQVNSHTAAQFERTTAVKRTSHHGTWEISWGLLGPPPYLGYA